MGQPADKRRRQGLLETNQISVDARLRIVYDVRCGRIWHFSEERTTAWLSV
jgi:hypothetical protein